MIYRKLDDDGDYTFGGSANSFYRNDPQGVAQSVITRLRLWENEWFLDISEGTPYLGGVMGKYTIDDVDSIIKDRIINTEGVTEITSYQSSFNPDLRKFSVSVTISTAYGEAVINEVL